MPWRKRWRRRKRLRGQPTPCLPTRQAAERGQARGHGKNKKKVFFSCGLLSETAVRQLLTNLVPRVPWALTHDVSQQPRRPTS